MSEEQQKNIPKYTPLPDFTVLAVGCIFVCGIPLIIYSIICGILTSIGPDAPGWGLYYIPISVLYIFPGIFLRKGSLLGWMIAVLYMSLYLLGVVIYMVWHLQYHQFFSFVLALCIITAIPLIFTLLDGKNYFAMVRQRKLAKKNKKDNS
jgi:peptidoglycan/LPS O-acetylase OafA/YrhL